jgi:hypothetical protein
MLGVLFTLNNTEPVGLPAPSFTELGPTPVIGACYDK